MLAAAALRNLDDLTGWIRLPHRLLDDLGNAALALFIAMALMTLRLWEMAGLAAPAGRDPGRAGRAHRAPSASGRPSA